MAKKTQFSTSLFYAVYNGFEKNPEDYLTLDFIEYVDDNLGFGWKHRYRSASKFEEFKKEAIVTGYTLRSTECKLQSYNLLDTKKVKLGIKLTGILAKKFSNKKRLRQIIDFFENHKQIGLGNKIVPFFIIDSYTTNVLFSDYADEIADEWYPKLSDVKLTDKKGELKVTKDLVQEISFRSTALGYYYHVAEELVQNKTEYEKS